MPPSPADLSNASFSSYPPAARALAQQHLAILRRLPLAFLPLLLREVLAYDWKFPAERADLEGQFRYLATLDASRFAAEMRPFSDLRLTPELAATDWVNNPAQFSEQLSAHLWATHQIEAFRTASVDYVAQLNRVNSQPAPARPRLTLVLLGQGAKNNHYPLFRKLRPHGTYYTNISNPSGRAAFTALLAERARHHPQPYAHWYIDGGPATPPTASPVAHVSYASLQDARDRLVAKMRSVMAPGGAGPEALRTMMARMSPADLGLSDTGPEALLNRFQISVLTEGSGTQLFSTTFVQWSAREILRRAQPLTLLLAYAPRQREQSMQEQISGLPHHPQPDPAGSLIDADMGAYYTWLNAQRLPGADQSHFLAWFEEGTEAIAIGPAFAKAAQIHDAVPLSDLLPRLS